jgi:hypothetical protein
MKPNRHATSRFMKWKFFSVLPGLMLAHAALATDPLYQNPNWSVLNYTFPDNPPPTIDATNFDNEGVFTVTFGVYNFNVEYYEPWNVRNYTNNGFMLVDDMYATVNPGFQFDTQTANGHQMANSFYNAGTISCGDTKNSAFLYGAGQLIVSATNITNPGQVEIGPNGFMLFTGGNVDLSYGTVAMNGFDISINPIAYGLDWSSGNNTNSPWSPATNLTPTHVRSSLFPTYNSPGDVNYMELNNPTPYYDIQGLGTSNVTLRAVFVQDSSPNASYNVYFSDNTPISIGGGADIIQDNIVWSGTYVDPVTGITATNYLVLDDATLLATNEPTANGIPVNFKFTSSTTPFSLGSPTSSAFPSGLFGIGLVTNLYSYFYAQFVTTTTATNASSSNPSGALTNLPGRIYITASGGLDLSMARITGPNYLSVTATNQFAGSIGAGIVSPYSDISLGVTNGFLTVTNLLQAALPNWSGTVEAWSSSWIFVTNGITNDFRVLLISSRLTPTTLSQVQHLNLYSRTNSVVISDAFNVMSTLFIDATNLTLTTNGNGNGATSIRGELNLESGGIWWPSSLPNMHNLTNSGAISSQNSIAFGSAAPSYITNTTPNTPAVAATGTLSEVNTSGNVATNNTVTIGTYTYTFVNTISNSVPNQVKIATAFDGSMSNLIAAINHLAGSGTSYSTNGTTNMMVTAGLLSGHSFTVTARTNGLSGDSIGITNSTATTNLTWGNNATLLSGGAEFVAGTTNITAVSGPYDNFINNGLISDQGSQIYANYFENGGTFANNIGSFNLQSQNVVLTNGSLTAAGGVSITAVSLVASNLVLQAGRSLALQVTDSLTDTGPANGNVWSVGGVTLVGLNLPIKPLSGDLLGTTITCTAPGPNKQVVNTWAGLDHGASTDDGYMNNEAIGVLILDAQGASSTFKFNGIAGTSNALYVDELVLLDSATNFGGTQVSNIIISPNMVIYYAQAMVNGASVAEKLNHLNNNRLLWVTNYAGHFSSINIVFTNGTTYPFNAALAQSQNIDSDGDGIPNGSDPTPFGVPPLITKQPVNVTTNAGGNATFSVTVSNISAPPLSYQWRFNSGALPNATNAVLILTGVTTNQAGIYSVAVINPDGSVTSSNAVLTVTNSSSFASTRINLTITLTNINNISYSYITNTTTTVKTNRSHGKTTHTTTTTKTVVTLTNKLEQLSSVIEWQTITNATNYVVYYTTNFTMINWLPLLTNTASPTSPPVTMMISDPVADPMRSYRVRGMLKQ